MTLRVSFRKAGLAVHPRCTSCGYEQEPPRQEAHLIADDGEPRVLRPAWIPCRRCGRPIEVIGTGGKQ